jgi:ADP-ribose pyrophosphatase
MKETQLKRHLKFKTSFMSLYEDDVILEDGTKTTRVVVDHPGAAAVLPITSDGEIILLYQYRYPIGAITLEIPAGKKDTKEERFVDCAKRELEEETGYTSEDIELLMPIYNCVGYSNEKIEIFVAKNCQPLTIKKEKDFDEVFEMKIVTLDEALKLIASQEIVDVKTIVSILYYARALNMSDNKRG